MAIRKRFNEVLGLTDTIEEERKRFVERVNQAIFHRMDTEEPLTFDYEALFRRVCFELGINAHELPSRFRHSSAWTPPTLASLAGGDFTRTLEVLCILYAWIKAGGDRDVGRHFLSDGIQDVLSRITCDIGVRWKDGLFYPSGAQELDKPLIEDVLTWLRDYRDEERNYRAALRHYVAGDSLPDVVTNCYSAVEGIARKILDNNDRLDRNVETLIRQIALSEGWKEVVRKYVVYAHDYRHADPVRHDITKQEAEAYLYMTGLIIRLAVESRNS